MLRAYKYRLYPTKKQEELLNKHFGCVRFIYNLALETKDWAWRAFGKNISHYDLMKQLPELKKEYVWLKDVCAESLTHSIFHLESAYLSFFKGKGDFPNYKNKQRRQSYKLPHGKEINIKGNKIYVPKFREGISFVQDCLMPGTIRQATVSKTPTGKYFISILTENNIPIPNKAPVSFDKSVGIDLGLKSFIVTSDGVTVDNPRKLKQALSKIKFLQRQVSKKKKGSNNRRKAIKRLAIQHEKVTNQRKDFLHKLSTDLIKNHDTICCEDLNIKGMVKNRSLAGSVSDVGWGEFVRQLKYKAEWYGKNILQIPTFEPSTKLCSNCGELIQTLTLADREWFCVSCGTLHDRDINAAINIKNYCLKNNGGEPHRQKPVELPVVTRSVETGRSIVRSL